MKHNSTELTQECNFRESKIQKIFYFMHEKNEIEQIKVL